MSPEPERILEVRGIRQRFGDRAVLDGLDFDLRRGETLVIMGESGSGKSTVLRMLLGLLRPDAGTIRFQGKEVTGLARGELNRLRQGMGMVYQESALISSLNVHDNVALPLRELSDRKPEEIEAVVAAKLEQVGVGEAKEKLPSELSGGMKKRVGLARALALEPSLVLFDEPSAGLDPVNAQLIDGIIVDLREKHHVTSIVVTHQMQSAFTIATRMAMLDDGKIVEEGSPEEFRRSKNPTVRKFLAADRRKEARHADQKD